MEKIGDNFNKTQGIGPAVFIPLSHPELRSIGSKAIHVFLKERERYLLRVSEAKEQGSSFTAITLVASIDFELLSSLIVLDTFPGVDCIHDLSDETLLDWLKKQDSYSSENLSVEKIDAMIRKNIRIKTHEPDAKLRIISLFTDYTTFLRQKKLENIIVDNPKMAVRHICSALKPQALRQKIENDLNLHKTHLKKDWKSFFKYILEKAVICDEFVSPREPFESQESNKGIAMNKKDGKTLVQSKAGASKEKKTGASKEKKDFDMAHKVKIDTQSKTESNASTSKLPPFCLNTETCPGERHYMNQCDKTPEEEKKQLLHEYRKKKEHGAARRVSEYALAKLPKHLLNERKGCIQAKLMDSILVTVSGDYGADHAAISGKIVQALGAKGKYIPMLTLKDPITMRLAVKGDDDSLLITANKKARITTTLLTSEGPLTLRNVDYLVFEEDMEDVLLSRPVLQSLGFNLDEHLKRVRENFDGKDFSKIGFEMDPTLSENAGKLARLVIRSPIQEQISTTKVESTGENILNNKLNLNTQMDIGVHKDDDVNPFIEEMMNEVEQNQFPNHMLPTLQGLLRRYQNLFRMKLGSDPPCRVSPMIIKLQPDAKPVRVRVRRYPQSQATFLRKKVSELEKLGLIFLNQSSAWACAPLIVPKAGPEQWRFTTDLRPVNKVTLPHAWPMPDLQSVTTRLAGKNSFASIDLCQGFWQLPLAKESQECQSFITPDGVYSPTRVMHGQKNAAAYCQSSLQQICKPIQDNMLLWLDDLLIYAASPEELTKALETFFQLCEKHNVKLHAAKCKLYLKKVKWCGRIIDGNGTQLDPTRLKGLKDMDAPKTGANLQQFLCAASWMRACIPEFTKRTYNLHLLLENVYSISKKRTKRAAEKVMLSDVGWNESHDKEFEAAKSALANAVNLSHPNPHKTTCLFTDASDRHWSGVLTQIPKKDIEKPFPEQAHEPLAFLSGSFTGSSSHWSTPEKEAAAIIFCIEKLEYLLLRPDGFKIFTDHSNLVFIFHPERPVYNLSGNSLNKVRRWGMMLSSFEYTIVHISGEENCWADLLSRWVVPQKNILPSLSTLFVAPPAPEMDPDFKWPSRGDIIDAQKSISEKEKTEFRLRNSNGLLVTQNGTIYIPAEKTHLQLRICVIGHCGRGGHRASYATISSIKDFFFWKTMNNDIQAFCNSCLHCALTENGARIPRPFGHALHSDQPNQIIHFDFLYMAESNNDFEYLLLIKDDASSYAWLMLAEEPTADIACKSLMQWFAAFGVAPIWISDRGRHFKNSLINKVNKDLHAHHHFTTPNNPQANGTIERLCREVLRCCRALLSEYRLPLNEWPSIIPIIQSVLNTSKRVGIGNRAPITAFTGLPPDNPLSLIIRPMSTEPLEMNLLNAKKVLNIEKLQLTLDQVHKDISRRRTKHRTAAIQRHNQKTHVQMANFDIGDFVLVAKKTPFAGSKLKAKWYGPQKITRVVSEWVYECQDLIDGNSALVHANRLKFYADSKLNVTEEILQIINHNDVHYNTVVKLMDIRYNEKLMQYEVQAKWRGFSHEDPTWEPLQIMHEDIPDMLKSFLDNFPNQGLVRKARSSLRRLEKRGV